MKTPAQGPGTDGSVESWRRYRPLLVLGVLSSGVLPVLSSAVGYTYLDRLDPTRLIIATAVAVVYSVAVYGVARLMARSIPSAVVFTITWSIAVFVFPRLTVPSKLIGLPEGGTAVAYLTLVALICALARGRPQTDYLAVPLSLCAVVTFVAGVLPIVPAYSHKPLKLSFAPLVRAGELHPPHRLPNIYHLVLDEMGRQDVLRARYATDLSSAEASLGALGFVVETDAVANYAQTDLSIPSMLNADYVRVPSGGADEVSQFPLHDAIQHNVVFAALREAGYRIEFLASDYSGTASNVQATTCRCEPPPISEFESDIVYRTPFRSLFPGDFDYQPHRRRVVETLKAFGAATALEGPGPHYTFAHVLGPHPPFIFKADGTFAPPRRAFTILDGSMFPGTAHEYRAGYAEQTEYLVRRVADAAAAVIARDPGAVIIVSGDHGPRLGFSASDARLTDSTEVLPVFLAIRWGGVDPVPVHVDSLVNVYRAVLNRYLGTNLPMLPTHSYVSSFARQYDLLERAVR